MDVVILKGQSAHGTVVLKGDEVWLVVEPAWYDIASKLFWWLMPSDKRAFLIVTLESGVRVRARAVRVSRRFVRASRVSARAEAPK